MRALCVLLVACSHAAAPAQSSPSAAPIAQPPPPPPTQTLARVGMPRGPWVDIRIDGVDEAATILCKRYVALFMRRGARANVRTLRDCATEPLARPTGPVQLVELDEANGNNLVAGELLVGERYEAVPEGSGTLQFVTLFDTMQACEAARFERDAEDQRIAVEVAVVMGNRAERALAEVIASEHQVCDELAAEQARCEKKRGDARTQCLLEVEPRRVECDNYKRNHADIEARRAAASTPRPPKPRSCRKP